jgi:hypothetical protein
LALGPFLTPFLGPFIPRPVIPLSIFVGLAIIAYDKKTPDKPSSGVLQQQQSVIKTGVNQASVL